MSITRHHVFASGILSFALLLLRCDDRDECQKATDYMSDCMQIDLSKDISDDRYWPCTGAKLARSECINAAECAAMLDAFRGGPSTVISQSLRDCLGWP